MFVLYRKRANNNDSARGQETKAYLIDGVLTRRTKNSASLEEGAGILKIHQERLLILLMAGGPGIFFFFFYLREGEINPTARPELRTWA